MVVRSPLFDPCRRSFRANDCVFIFVPFQFFPRICGHVGLDQLWPTMASYFLRFGGGLRVGRLLPSLVVAEPVSSLRAAVVVVVGIRGLKVLLLGFLRLLCVCCVWVCVWGGFFFLLFFFFFFFFFFFLFFCLFWVFWVSFFFCEAFLRLLVVDTTFPGHEFCTIRSSLSLSGWARRFGSRV